MQNVCLLFFILIYSGNLFSQNRFYIRPVLNTNAYMSYSNPNHKLNPSYFEYKIKRPGYLAGMEGGGMAGYQFNKKRNTLEIGFQQSSVMSGYALYFLLYDDYSPDPIYYSSSMGSQSGAVGSKIPILMSTQIIKWDSLYLYRPTTFSLHCNLIVGINYYQQNGEFSSTGRTVVMLSPTISMDVKDAMYAGKWRAVLYEAGLSFELRKKQREWFTFCFYYHQAFRELSQIYTTITITDIANNKIEEYSYSSLSRGSSIYFEISKKFFVTKIKRKE